MIASLLMPCVLATAGLQQPDTAAGITEASRSIERALTTVFAGRGRGEQAPERQLFLLVDATESLRKSTFQEQLSDMLERFEARLARTRIGLGRVGHRGVVVVEPTLDHDRVLRAVTGELAKPSGAIQNVYADLRTLAPKLSGKPGRREILLVTLDNGDAEDDLEATASLCAKLDIAVTALTSESYLADCYWRQQGAGQAPRGTTMTGGDNPFVDLPYGWLFQRTHVNEVTPSGHACYGINRVVSKTGGRVFLYAPRSDTKHRCSHHDPCLFCNGDHIPAGESYMSGRMADIAPTVASRKQAYKDAAKDPCTRDVLVAWRDAAKNGLLRSSPPLRLASTSAKPERNRGGRLLPMFTLGFKRNAAKADKAGKQCDRILGRLTERLESVQRHDRSRANAELTRLLLQITRVNLALYAGWCRETAPGLVARDPEHPLPPEQLAVNLDRRPVGVSFTSMCLCHGVKPFLRAELPGGESVREELEELDAMWTRFMERYAHTPYAVAAHRAGLARFHLTYVGVVAKAKRKKPKSRGEDEPETEKPRNRPKRGASSGSSAGPTTGGN